MKLSYLVGPNLKKVMEETRQKGLVAGGLNAKFIILIVKCSSSWTFNDYRPIALCNLAYKVITKFLTNRLKKVLSKGISKEQLGFLFNRQILDGIGSTQEGSHFFKVKKSHSLVLKLDLKKLYDQVDCAFPHLVHLKIGMNVEITNWIMGCIEYQLLFFR